MNEAILILIKPDGLVKSLTGNIISKLSEAKLEIIAAKIVQVSKELAEEHYQHLKDKPFFDELIKYIQGDLHSRKKVMAMVYYGKDAIQKVRNLAGDTNPEEADSVSIRGAYGRITTSGVFENVVHASSEPAEAEREIKLWFQPKDIIFELYPSEFKTISKETRVWKE
jgi:nucleoside-diphosphate kinase